MRLIHSGRFDYPGYHGSRAHCWLDIYGGDPDRPTVVIMTEARDNGGTSVSHGSETIAALACRTFRLDPRTTLFVEHYGPSRALALPERYAFVEYHANGRQRHGGLGQPRWTPTTRERVERLVGRALVEPRP